MIELPEFLGELVNLEILDCTQNNIVKLPQSISRLTGLKQLKAYGNQISGDISALQGLSLLERIDLGNNCLSELNVPV